MRINEVTLNRDDVKQFILTNCSSAVNDQPIWRGIRSSNAPYIQIDSTSKGLRPAANTIGYVNLLISEMADWRSYPRRQVICTTDRMSAAGYGTAYRIFPVNETVIGICPGHDFWQLPYLKQKTSLNVYKLDDAIQMLGLKFLKRSPNSKSIEALQSDLAEIASICISENFRPHFLSEITTENSILTQLTNLLNPTTNQISTQPIETFSVPKNREVWFDSKAIAVVEKECWIMGFREFR